jgi:hypothetical protein
MRRRNSFILSASSQHDRARIATRRESVDDDDDGREEGCLCDEIADLGRRAKAKRYNFLRLSAIPFWTCIRKTAVAFSHV